jgi:hypothetical protein
MRTNGKKTDLQKKQEAGSVDLKPPPIKTSEKVLCANR